jgi:hypothetical protein
MQGMGFSNIAQHNVATPFERMINNNLVDSPIFSFWLDRKVSDSVVCVCVKMCLENPFFQSLKVAIYLFELTGRL